MKKKIISVIICALLVLSLFTACAKTQTETPSETQANAKDKKIIVCSIFPIYDFCREIMGDKGDIKILLDSKTDLHSYQPTADDVLLIANSDMFIYVGGESDSWAEDVINSANNPQLKAFPIISAVNAVEEEEIEGMMPEEEESDDAEEEPEIDEHVWTSLKNAQKIVTKICDNLCEIDEKNSDEYKNNAAAYNKKLSALDKEYEETVSSAKRTTMLFADRFPFRYLAEDYGLTYYAAFKGCSAETEASFETIAFLIDKTKELALPFILTIDGSDSEVAQSVSDATGAKIATLNSYQSVPTEDIEKGATYYSIAKDNLEVLKEVLN